MPLRGDSRVELRPNVCSDRDRDERIRCFGRCFRQRRGAGEERGEGE